MLFLSIIHYRVSIQFYMSLPFWTERDATTDDHSRVLTLLSFQSSYQLLRLQYCSSPSEPPHFQLVLTSTQDSSSSHLFPLPLLFPPSSSLLPSHLFTLTFTPSSCKLFIDSHYSSSAAIPRFTAQDIAAVCVGDACAAVCVGDACAAVCVGDACAAVCVGDAYAVDSAEHDSPLTVEDVKTLCASRSLFAIVKSLVVFEGELAQDAIASL